jgi:hypothetical protein
MANLELVKVVRPLGTDLEFDGVEGLNYNMMEIEGSKQNSVDEPLISEDTVDGPMGDFYEIEDTTSRLQLQCQRGPLGELFIEVLIKPDLLMGFDAPHKYLGMLDTSLPINLMPWDMMCDLGYDYCRGEVKKTIHLENGTSIPLGGRAKNVQLTIGTMKIMTTFYMVDPDVTPEAIPKSLILGRKFMDKFDMWINVGTGVVELKRKIEKHESEEARRQRIMSEQFGHGLLKEIMDILDDTELH